tara:strand:- start:78 stop:572 length:495 start_codon:yes stop_codon:yes gene_type:complete
MYTHKQNGALTEIYRDDVHVANFDPVEEEISYTKKEFKRFSKHVARVVNSLDAAPAKVEKPVVKPTVKVEKPVVKSKSTDELKRENMRLKLENVRLNDEVLRLKKTETLTPKNPRYADVFDDSEGRHLRGPHGDMTPEYVEWARENMPKEIFAKRYRGRLPDVK